MTARGDSRQTVHRRLALAGGCCLLAVAASGQTFSNLYSFSGVRGNADGGYPSSLLLSSNGQFYGTCVNDGMNGWGDVYQMASTGTPAPAYSFTYSSTTYDGATPYAGLTQGTNGLLYGMAKVGGTNGSGTIFAVKTNGTSFTSLYSFARLRTNPKTTFNTNADGATPGYALALNTNNGNFYGTAQQGGTNSYGTVFEVTHQGKVTVFYSFSNSVDGATPQAPLMLHTNGSLYGTALGGGSNGYGTIFQVTSAGRVTPIYSFTNGSDGAAPEGALVNGKDGYLYGTCSAGGTNGSGTIFKITTNGVLTPLYSFTPGITYQNDPDLPQDQYNADGIYPKSLLLGSDGNFYGVAYYGGLNGAGSVFQFTRSGELNVLYSFNNGSYGPNSDGANPISLIQYTDGNLYGTAYQGGSNGVGTFFSIGLTPSITTQPASQATALRGNASFSLTCVSAQSCQWQFDGANLPNATNYTLFITNAQITNAGFYQAIVTNLNGATTSCVVSLSITDVPVRFLTSGGAMWYGGGQFSVEVSNLTGQGAMVIEASTNLMQWAPICTNPSGFGTAPFTDAAAGNFPFRYYRATTPGP